MNKYNFKKTLKLKYNNKSKLYSGKIVFKTAETAWINTDHPVIIPISIHSSFHVGIRGEMKVETLFSVVKQNTNGPITILLADEAHLNVLKLAHQNAKDICKRDTLALTERFERIFQGCELTNWEEFLKGDSDYKAVKNELENLYKNDTEFKKLLITDANSTYTPERKEKHPNHTLFLKETIKDLIECCVLFVIASKKGYRYLFYPGKQYPSFNYFYNRNKLIDVIDAFISIERFKEKPSV